MNASQERWQDILSRVPAAAELPPAEGEVSIVLAKALPRIATRVQHLVAVQAAAAGGRTQLRIEKALRSNVEQRMAAWRKEAHKLSKAFVVFPALLLVASAIVLLYPIDNGYYSLDLGGPTVFTSLLAVAGLVYHAVLEKTSRPRSLPYSPSLFLAYAVGGGVGSGILIAYLASDDGWVPPEAWAGGVISAAAFAGFIVLFFWVVRRPTLMKNLHGESREGRDFDESLRRASDGRLRSAREPDGAPFQARAAEGVRLLVETNEITADDAVWILGEIVDEGARPDEERTRVSREPWDAA